MEEDVVGFDKQTCDVMEMLMPEGGGLEDEGLRVVSIIGMGGLGKSTLARKIFNCEEIKFHFEARVWVVVSERVDAKHVLKNILQYLKVNIEKEDDEYLKGRLKEHLDGSKYLIVLDDLWTPKQWEELKSYLPTDQKRGSRILLTSRIENVANVASTDSTTYHLDPLGDDDAWRLFCKKALKGEACPPNLVDVGKGIASKCKGLPLAIVVLGGSLSAAEAKPSFGYWSKILGDTSWHPDADNDCSKILSLSYRNLPSHLRTCFLYVGVFPEDFEIQAKELCLLWVAEGFVKGQSRELEEDLAEQYLINLADRNLIMNSKRRSNGSIKSCRIHDLLRDLCIKEAEKCDLYKLDAIGAYQNVNEGIRRLAMHKHDYSTLLLPPLYRGLRTLLDFANNDSSNLRSICEDLSVMRVLHLHVEEEGYKPIRTENMILLRYLKVDQSGLVDLSWVIMIPYISEISNLQVLILNSKDSEHTTDLPKGILKLKFLRHIYVRKKATMPGAQSSHDSLPYLQTLSCIIYEEHTSKMLCPARFPNLRKLSVHVDHQNPLGAETLQSLCKLLHFVSLKISYDTYRWESSGPLYVDSFPSTLTKIHLDNTALTSNSWRLLGELKNLQVLKLRTRKTDTSCEEEMFVKQPLVFKAEAFPQLLHLKLRTHHPALILENGALRTLQYLIIRNWLLADLPYKLWLSTTLRQVKIIEPSSSLSSYIQSLDDSKHSKVTLRDGALRSLQYLIIRPSQLSTLSGQLGLSTSLRQVQVIYTSVRMLDYFRSLGNSWS
uniref:NB-ARC domain-containing protein n=1 Tax=Kalanchoe fedtschenkoi TaxID=63787 RepID=A0A7N1A626_KALFE